MIVVPSLSNSPAIAEKTKRGVDFAIQLNAAEAEVKRVYNLQNAADDNKARAAKIVAGETLPPSTSNVATLQAAARDRLNEAKLVVEIHGKQHAELVRKEGEKLRQSLRPAVVEVEKRIAAKVSDLVGELMIVERMKGDLGAQGLGWYGPYVLDTDFFGSMDRAGDLAQLLRQCVALGYIKSLPAEWR